MTTNIQLLNHSSVTEVDYKNMIEAINIHLVKFCGDWHLAKAVVHASPFPDASLTFILSDEPRETKEVYDGIVYAKPILDPINGGAVLYNGASPTVASAVSHLVMETLTDRYSTVWYQKTASKFVSGDVCDPVHDGIVAITTPGGVQVGLCNYILPSWTNPAATVGPFDRLGVLDSPFSISPGGYAVIINMYGGKQYMFNGKTQLILLHMRLKNVNCRAYRRANATSSSKSSGICSRPKAL